MVNQQQLSIRQLTRLAKVSVRTLQYYDQTGLLKPQRQEENSYRLYDSQTVLRLQQILFYKELGFDLKSIKLILDHPGFEYQEALLSHREALLKKVEQTKQLIQTIDRTLDQMKGKIKMPENEYFVGFSDEQQAEYEIQAAERWDPVVVKESNRRWKALSDIEKQDLMKNGERITLALRDAMSEGSGSEKVQNWLKNGRNTSTSSTIAPRRSFWVWVILTWKTRSLAPSTLVWIQDCLSFSSKPSGCIVNATE